MMTDREKVIKGLQIHADGCGYRSHHCDAMECPYRYGDESCDIEEMCRDALELLKEQEGIVPYIDIDEAKCPVCKVKLTRQELLGDDVLYEDFFDYCPRCGRKVKWE